MESLFYLISEEGLATFIVVVLLIGIGAFARWFATNYTARVDSKYAELMREISEIKTEVLDSNLKIYNIVEQLIANSRVVGEDINAIESSLDTLLKFISKNGNK